MWFEEHLRHCRGYGVHSPMLYRIVREAMMPRRIRGDRSDLYDALRRLGVDRRTALRMQNLLSVGGYENWQIDTPPAQSNLLTVATTAASDQEIEEMVARLSKYEGAVCVIFGLWGGKRRNFCRQLTDTHHSMSAEKPAFMLYISRRDIQKQHIVI